VKAIKGGRVRLAITAPKDVSVHRMEIYDAIKANAEDCSLAVAIAGVISREKAGGA
jgi:carbon storage regulator CsrA